MHFRELVGYSLLFVPLAKKFRELEFMENTDIVKIFPSWLALQGIHCIQESFKIPLLCHFTKYELQNATMAFTR